MNEIIDVISITIAIISLILSGLTAWLTLLRKGTLKMTRPNVLAFGFDGPQGPPKIFLRTLLFSTARRGHVVESMFVKVQREKTVQTFSDWGYGDSKLVFGSGVYVPHEGIAYNHHFLLPKNITEDIFFPGKHIIEVYASLVNKKSPIRLFQINLLMNEQDMAVLGGRNAFVIFTWNPDLREYVLSTDKAFKL